MIEIGDDPKVFTEEGTAIGALVSSSGSVLLTDGVWESSVPSHEKIAIDLHLENKTIPIRAIKIKDKRYLILSLDEAVESSEVTSDVVEVTDLPKEEETPAEEEKE